MGKGDFANEQIFKEYKKKFKTNPNPNTKLFG